MKRLTAALLAGVLAFALPAAIPDGVARGESNEATEAALDALDSARLLHENPLQRILIRRYRVSDIRQVECPQGSLSDYSVRVRYFTLWAIPIGVVPIRCGNVDPR